MESEDPFAGFYDCISLEEFVELLVKQNPHASAAEVTESLKYAVSLKKEGVGCVNCGKPIWAIGLALSRVPMCFSCITGEAMPDDEYEIDEVC
ncbi:MAG: hypothetical protein M5U34_46215 [Chloroflexi bacterium]|nr:hypothetical protein [Chloroflexota bacterium]